MTAFRQVNPDLMLPAGLEAALDQRGAGQRCDRCDVRDGPSCAGRRLTRRASKVAVRPAQTIATIEDQGGVDSTCDDCAMGDRVILPIDVVRAEALRQHTF